MIRSSKWRGGLLVACLSLAAAASPVRADEVPIITGEHWTKSSEQLKKAYLLGVANVLQIESAYQGSNPPSDAQSLVPTVAKGLRGQTLDTVRDTLDRWYAANPDKLNRPVFETLWYEIVVPGSRKPA